MSYPAGQAPVNSGARLGAATKIEKKSTRHGEGLAKKYETRRRHASPSDTIAYSGIAEGTWAPDPVLDPVRGPVPVRFGSGSGSGSDPAIFRIAEENRDPTRSAVIRRDPPVDDSEAFF